MKRSHCKKGHILSEENRASDGRCIICRRAYDRARVKRDLKKRVAATANWRRTHRDKYLQSKRAYNKKRREAMTAEERRELYLRYGKSTNMNRRASQKEGIKRFGRIDERLIDNYVSKICGICQLKIESKYEIDHIIPLARNGTHTIENLQLVHPICNRVKSDRLQKEIELDIFMLRALLT